MSTPELVLKKEELESLHEYSCSLPTGTTIGKRWKRKRGVDWMIGEYVDIGSDTEVGIQWYWAVDENHEPHRSNP